MEHDERSVRLEDLIERLAEHDELSAEGLEEELEKVQAGEGPRMRRLQELIDTAEELLRPYETI